MKLVAPSCIVWSAACCLYFHSNAPVTDTSATAETSFWGLNAFYSFEGEGLPSISVGYESEDPSAGVTEEGYFVGLTWDSVGAGSLSVGLSSVENYKDSETEYYQ